MDVDEEIRQVTLDLHEQIPNFEKRGRVLKMITKDIDDDLPEARIRIGPGVPAETPVKNLFNVGDAVVVTMGIGGTTGAVEGAKRLAEIVMKRISPREK
jgi:hypothetical protein